MQPVRAAAKTLTIQTSDYGQTIACCAAVPWLCILTDRQTHVHAARLAGSVPHSSALLLTGLNVMVLP